MKPITFISIFLFFFSFKVYAQTVEILPDAVTIDGFRVDRYTSIDVIKQFLKARYRADTVSYERSKESYDMYGSSYQNKFWFDELGIAIRTNSLTNQVRFIEFYLMDNYESAIQIEMLGDTDEEKQPKETFKGQIKVGTVTLDQNTKGDYLNENTFLNIQAKKKPEIIDDPKLKMMVMQFEGASDYFYCGDSSGVTLDYQDEKNAIVTIKFYDEEIEPNEKGWTNLYIKIQEADFKDAMTKHYIYIKNQKKLNEAARCFGEKVSTAYEYEKFKNEDFDIDSLTVIIMECMKLLEE